MPAINIAAGLAAEKKNKIIFNIKILLPTISAVFTLLVHLLLPDSPNSTQKPLPYFTVSLIIAIAVTLIYTILSLYKQSVGAQYAFKSWFYAAFILFLNIWNIVTLKLMLIPTIYFPSPDRILKVFVEDWQFILKCLAYSARLLASGFVLGAVLGITTGILVGWSKRWSYWVNPLIKLIGPIPSTAWVPIALVSFASSFQASVFLIALAVWFPTTVLTSSGISNVQNAYFEVSSTLGAKTPAEDFQGCAARRHAQHFYRHLQRHLRILFNPDDSRDARCQIRNRLVYQLAARDALLRKCLRGTYRDRRDLLAHHNPDV